jgi:cytochrome P450
MLDIFGDFSSQDPAAALAEAAQGCPYQWEPETHALYVLRAHDVKEVLTSRDFWSERAPDPRATALDEADVARRARLREFFALWPVFSDGDHHRRMRHVAIWLLRDVVTPEFLDSCARLVDRRFAAARGGTFDWMEQIARPLARAAVATMTGGADAGRLIELGSVVMSELATPRIEMARIDAALEAIDVLREWLRTALADPPAPFVAGLAQLWNDEEFGPDSATALLTQLVTGAYEPIVTALCVAAERITGELLCRMPPQKVRDELFRLATPFRFASRYARRPVILGPHRLETGDRAVLCLGTANLDPVSYPKPLELQRRTRKSRPLSFGLGAHYCPGAPLAQGVVGVLLDSLLAHGVHFSVECAEREPELSMLRYRRLDGRLVRSADSSAA